MKSLTIITTAILFGFAAEHHSNSFLFWIFSPTTLLLGLYGFISFVRFISFDPQEW